MIICFGSNNITRGTKPQDEKKGNFRGKKGKNFMIY